MFVCFSLFYLCLYTSVFIFYLYAVLMSMVGLSRLEMQLRSLACGDKIHDASCRIHLLALVPRRCEDYTLMLIFDRHYSHCLFFEF